MDYEQKYKEALEIAKEIIKYYKERNRDEVAIEDLEVIFPELAKSEDERIRKDCIKYLHWEYQHCPLDKDKMKIEECIAWLEKQGKPNPYSGISFNYNGHTWGMCARDNGVDILLDKQLFKHLEKQGETKPFDYENANIQQKDFASIEPKFKVKYAGSEYNVFETKEIAGVTYYGIEDEPNHIDYVQAENCERVGGYSIKEKGSPYPTKPAVFSAWSEEDESRITTICTYLQDYARLSGSELRTIRINEYCDWLKSLRPQNRWKPSDEQMNALLDATLQYSQVSQNSFERLNSLFNDLKKLKG